MNVAKLIVALQALEQDTPVSHELLAELAPVDDGIYEGGAASFHPSIYAFRKQRFMRAAAAAMRAITKLQEAGWNARVTQESIGSQRDFVLRLEFVVTPIDEAPGGKPFCGDFKDLCAAEEVIADGMRGLQYEIDNGWVITEEGHRRKFDAALSADDILEMVEL